MNFLLSTAYLPPLSYFSLFFQEDEVFLEGCEHFQKQSFRNRAYILSPKGNLCLTVPIQKASRNRVPIKDVKISYALEWQRLHWMSLQSAYRRSTYFEYFEDDLAPFFEKKYPFLWDLNWEWMVFIGQFYGLDMNKKVLITKEYHDHYVTDWCDLRKQINPKKNLLLTGDPYPQVFSADGQFHENTSIVDLLFNLGKSGANYLKNLSERNKSTYLERE